MTTEERRSVKAEDLVDGFPTRKLLLKVGLNLKFLHEAKKATKKQL
jgi:hypothetical protein